MIKRLRKFIHRLATRIKTFRVQRPTLKGTTQFVTKTVKGIYSSIFDFVKGVLSHFEMIVIIILATIGLTALLSEIGWLMAISLPFWLEVDMFFPVLSAGFIWLLIRVLQWRKGLRVGGAVIA